MFASHGSIEISIDWKQVYLAILGNQK